MESQKDSLFFLIIKLIIFFKSSFWEGFHLWSVTKLHKILHNLQKKPCFAYASSVDMQVKLEALQNIDQ